MRWFGNRRTATKILIGYAFVLACTAAVGAAGIVGMSKIRARLEDASRADDGVAELLAARVAILGIARAVGDALLARSPGEVDGHLGGVAELEKRFDTQFDRYEKGVADETIRQKARATHERFRQLRAAQDRAVQLAREGKGDEARAVVNGARTIADQIDASIGDLIEDKVAWADASQQDAFATYRRGLEVQGLLLALAAVSSLLAGFGIARTIAGPLRRAAWVLERVAAGDLTRRLDLHSRDELGALATSLNDAIAAMAGTLREVAQAAAGTAEASGQLSGAASQLSSGSHQQASSLEETAASLEEILGTVTQTAENAAQASQLAVGSREIAERGGTVVHEAIAAMEAINESSRRIADIITTIDEIAFQTNLLALNAAVEAARAGEQGRGFAVVAAEVRSLAQRSATAAKEIKTLIGDSVAKVRGGSELVNRSGASLEEIVSAVKRVTDIVSEIAAASAEQSSGIDQVNGAMSRMDHVTQTVASQTEELSATAATLATQAARLRSMVARFTLDARAEVRVAAAAAGVATNAAVMGPVPPAVAHAVAMPTPPARAYAGRVTPVRVAEPDDPAGGGFQEF